MSRGLEAKDRYIRGGVLEKGLRITVLDVAIIKFVDEFS